MELEKEQAQEFAYWCFVTRDPQLAAQKIGMDNGAALQKPSWLVFRHIDKLAYRISGCRCQ